MKLFLALFYLLFEQFHCFKILRTPLLIQEKISESSFAVVQNPLSPSSSKLSLCIWVSQTFENKFNILSAKDERGFSILFDPSGNTISIDGVDIQFKFPPKYNFIPEKWIFFCFAFDNTDKKMKIFRNAENIFEKKIKSLENYEIHKDFVGLQQIGKATQFVGDISDMNIWSEALEDAMIEKLYACQEIPTTPDVLSWNNADLELGPGLFVWEGEEPCMQNKKIGEKVNIFPLLTSMEPKHKVVRLCEGLGGSMGAPQNENNLKYLSSLLKNTSQVCPINKFWLPLFKNPSLNTWQDYQDQTVEYLNWKKGEPNNEDNTELCITVNEDMEYADYR